MAVFGEGPKPDVIDVKAFTRSIFIGFGGGIGIENIGYSNRFDPGSDADTDPEKVSEEVKKAYVNDAGLNPARSAMPTNRQQPTKGKGWSESLTALARPEAIAMLFLGFSAGLPLLLIFSTLSVWLKEAGVDRSTVTYFSWAALGYSFKFVWAPLVDRLPVPWLSTRMGRRRGWLLASQVALVAAMLWTAAFDPQQALALTAIGAVCIGFASATQDIVIDAYRIESAEPAMQSLLSSMYIAGYRIGMIAAGAGSLWLADWWGADTYDAAVWTRVYRVMAGAMSVGIVTTLLIREPVVDRPADTFRKKGEGFRFLSVFFLVVAAFVAGFLLSGNTGQSLKHGLMEGAGMAAPMAGLIGEAARLVFSTCMAVLAAFGLILAGVVPVAHVRETYIDPVADFLSRYGLAAVIILALIGSYRLADVLMGVIANIFYLDMGYTKSQIATITKLWGLLATLGGGFVGGILSLRYGVFRILFLGSVLAAASNLLFAYAAGLAPDTWLLMAVIVADNASAGLASAAFVAYLSGLTSVSFTAMQYALFSSLMTLLPKVLAGYSGAMVNSLGYETFFVLTAVAGIPVALLVIWAARVTGDDSPPSAG